MKFLGNLQFPKVFHVDNNLIKTVDILDDLQMTYLILLYLEFDYNIN
jgi:hypothetical protein